MEIGMDSAAADDTAELIHGFVRQRFPLASSKKLTPELSLLVDMMPRCPGRRNKGRLYFVPEWANSSRNLTTLVASRYRSSGICRAASVASSTPWVIR